MEKHRQVNTTTSGSSDDRSSAQSGGLNLCPLSALTLGQEGTVVDLRGGRRFKGRLLSMGLHVGSKVAVIRPANGNHGPVLVASGQARLGIGRGMAEQIMVSLADGQ